jgi:hypothetical protein
MKTTTSEATEMTRFGFHSTKRYPLRVQVRADQIVAERNIPRSVALFLADGEDNRRRVAALLAR